MAIISIPSGSPTLASWLLALRRAATNGKVPESFETLTQAQLLQACRKAGVPVIEGRIDARYKGEVYFALREMLDVPVRWERLSTAWRTEECEIAGQRVHAAERTPGLSVVYVDGVLVHTGHTFEDAKQWAIKHLPLP